MSGCVFCSVVMGESPSFTVAVSDLAVAFLDVNPASQGHTLVVPRRHADDIWDLSAEDSAGTWALVTETAKRLRDRLAPDGITLFQANRRAGWQDVFHFHVHVVPRWKGDGLVRPWESTPVDHGELERVAAMLE
jgi:histidine triad (HIT) family protein